MRIVLVDNLLFEDAEGVRRYILQPHLGLISLIAVLEAAGHEAVLFDPKVEVSRGHLQLDENLYREIARRLLLLCPDVVGFTSLGCNFICTAKTAEYLKASESDIPILLGGPHATVLDRAILRSFPQFDVIIRSEAEQTIVPVIEALTKGNFGNLPGITFRTSGNVLSNPGETPISDLDVLPVPAYHSYPIRELGLKSLRVDAGRGCPFQCTFCSTASFFGRKYRLKSAARLCAELDFLHETYGISDFSLTHDLFTVNRRKVIEFCETIEGRGYTWKCSARQDCVDEKLLERMAAAGCRSIYYGIEAGSSRMQEISKKRLDLRLFDPILRATQRIGMSVTVSFITGYPEELAADQDATLDLIGECFSRDSAPINVQLHLLTPEPGTELLGEYSGRIAYDGHISDFNFPVLEVDDSEIIERHPNVFINHHYFPSALPRSRHIFVTTSYQYLYGLGFPLLRYILRHYGGRLSSLINSIERWQRQERRQPSCDQYLIEAYFSDNFGVSHHITGLVRYMLRAAELRRRATNDAPSNTDTSSPARKQYRLSRRAAVLRRVPDCQRILQSLNNGARPPLSATLLRRRYDFLLHLSTSGIDEVRNYELSAASAALLDFLDAPRQWPELDAFEQSTGFPMPPAELLNSLAARGVLEWKSEGPS